MRVRLLAIMIACVGCSSTGLLVSDGDPQNAAADAGIDASSSDASTAGPRLIFVSTFTTNGGFASGGENPNVVLNALCTTELLKSTPKKTGSAIAWISTSSHDVADDITSQGPWVLPSGDLVASNRDALLSAAHSSAIDEHADGTQTPSLIAWTGSNAAGDYLAVGSSVDVATCDDWTSASPTSTGLCGITTVQGNMSWSVGPPTPCDTLRPVYCLEP